MKTDAQKIPDASLNRAVANPNGIPASSPGLRGTSYPGSASNRSHQPQWGCGGSHLPFVPQVRLNPVGVAGGVRSISQGSSCLATLGWRTQSLWDWANRALKRIEGRAPFAIAMLVVFAVFAPAFHASAQSDESEPPPALGQFEAAPLPPPEQPFLVPDVPQTLLERFQMREPWFTLKVAVSAVFDYTAFHQDANSLSQVGKQDDTWQVRDLRLMLRRTIRRDYRFNYF